MIHDYYKFIKYIKTSTTKEIDNFLDKLIDDLNNAKKENIYTYINPNLRTDFKASLSANLPLSGFLFDLKEAFFIKNLKYGAASSKILDQYNHPYTCTVYNILRLQILH